MTPVVQKCMSPINVFEHKIPSGNISSLSSFTLDFQHAQCWTYIYIYIIFAAISCPILPVWTKYTANTSRHEFGIWVNYSCSDGYEMSGAKQNHVTFCDKTGKWTPDPVMCKLKFPVCKVEKYNKPKKWHIIHFCQTS